MATQLQPLLSGEAEKPQGFFNSRLDVLMVAGGHFVHDVFSSFLPIILPLLIDRLGLSLLAAGTFTLFFRLPTFFSPFIGRLADVRNLGVLAAVAPAITAITMSLLGNAPGYASVCALVLVAGISSSTLHVLGPVMIARNAAGRYGSGMGMWMLGGESARAAGPIFAAWCLTVFAPEKIYPVMIIGILVSLLLLAGRQRTVGESAGLTDTGARQSWTALMTRMLPFATAITTRAAMVGMLVSFLPTYLVTTGKSLWAGGLAFALLQCGGIFGTLIGGWTSDRYGHRNVLLVAFPVSAVLMAALVTVPGRMLYPVLILLGVIIFAIAPVILALVQAAFDKEKGAATGIYTTINFGATAIATVLSGWAADRWGFPAAFFLNAALGIITVPTLLWLGSKRPADPAVPHTKTNS